MTDTVGTLERRAEDLADLLAEFDVSAEAAPGAGGSGTGGTSPAAPDGGARTE